MTGTSLGSVYEQFAACRQPPYAPEGGDAGARLRDAGRRLWPCPQRPAAGAHLYKYNSGTGNWDDYTRLLNRTIAARWRGWPSQQVTKRSRYLCCCRRPTNRRLFNCRGAIEGPPSAAGTALTASARQSSRKTAFRALSGGVESGIPNCV